MFTSKEKRKTQDMVKMMMLCGNERTQKEENIMKDTKLKMEAR